ncbi:hypothetical protein GEV33_004336 [Tenebrio molitor]|uniref:Reverse transcriptase domain-containing protein n=1 Tax=Tenebrio molitor TaxID=7067 RepID=A0A8J6HGN8_TENMO|nr:hypothetical protein GEV33_004336 [Tenebrio molitor]
MNFISKSLKSGCRIVIYEPRDKRRMSECFICANVPNTSSRIEKGYIFHSPPPPPGRRAAEAFHSLFSHTDGKFWMGAVRTGAEGRCGKTPEKTHYRSGGTGVRTRDLPNAKWRARRLATVLAPSYRGANIDSDHLLVVAKMRMKVVKQTEGSRKNRWDVEKLNYRRHNDEYKKEMRKKLETREEEVDIDEEWKNLKESIMDTAETVLGRRTTRKRKKWFDEESEKITEAKNQARNRWLNTGNLRDFENYKEKRKEATKYCKHKKESWIGELMQEVEVNNRDSRKLLQTTFDNINRHSLVEQMQQMKIPEKLIKLTKMTMDNSRARISTTECVTNEINIERGVRQGDALSTTLFNIALGGAIKAAGLDRAITASATQVIAYAGDVALITRDKKSLGAALQKLVTETEKRGLQLNQDKTKYMIISRRKTDYIRETNLGSYTFKKVENFKYLGVNVNEKNERSAEIKERIQAANKAYWKEHHDTTDQVLKVVEQIITSFNWNKHKGDIFLDVAKVFHKAWHQGLLHKLIRIPYRTDKSGSAIYKTVLLELL